MAGKKKGEKGSTYVFLKDPDYAWIPAKLIRQNGNTADVQIPEYSNEQNTICDGGKSAKKIIDAEVDLTYYSKCVLPMQNVNESGMMKTFPDMVELPFLHEVSYKSFFLFVVSFFPFIKLPRLFLCRISIHLILNSEF